MKKLLFVVPLLLLMASCKELLDDFIQKDPDTGKPEVCAQIYMPVCGTDGKTYSNECMARAAGVGVLNEGQCSPALPDTGITCTAYFESWFFMASTKKCEKIGYSGCSPRGYQTKEECESCNLK